MSLFNALLSKKYEDLSTEVLIYLLSKNYSKSEFRNRFLKLLGIESSNNEFEFKSQVHTGESGIPDIIGFNGDTLIIIENKLISYLSGDDQLIKYLNIFDPESANYIMSSFQEYKSDQIKQKIFAILAPKSILPNLLEKTNKYLNDKFDRNISIENYCTVKNVNLISNMTWQVILDSLNEDLIIEKELKQFVTEYLDFELSQENYEEIKKIGLVKGDLYVKEFKTSLNIFSQELLENSINTHSIPYAKEDVYFPIELKEDSLAYFGYFNRAHRKCKESVFFLEIKEKIDCKLFEEANLKYFSLNGSNPEFFICFDFINRNKWVDDIKRIKEII